MSGPADLPPIEAAVALRAFARADSGADRLVAALAAAVEAMGGRYGAVLACGRDGAARVVAQNEVPDSVAQRLVGGAEALLQEAAAERPQSVGDTLGDTALALPVSGAPGGGAVLIVGGPGGTPEGTWDHVARIAVASVGAALEVARLREDLERAMAQILERDERILGRIGLDIHDGPTQQLSVALLEVQLLEADLADAAAGAALPRELVPALGRIYETLGGALHEMREIIGYLRPAQFEGRRLSDILQDAVTAFEARSDCAVEVRFDGEFPVNGVSITQRITFYRVLQEALENARHHGGARHAVVEVRERPEGIALQVADDGAGFDPSAVLGGAAGDVQTRFGLRGMRDRAEMLGGTFQVESRPGEGAVLRMCLPRWRPGAGEGA